MANGLKALLISDRGSRKTSHIQGDEKLAALGLLVDVGWLNDPKKYPGIAHFLEHSVFLGSQKFPTPYSFKNHLNKFGGSLFAYTTPTKTSFNFDVCEDNLKSTTERFADFIKEPLLRKALILQERNVIESEFCIRKQNEDIRRIAILDSVCGSPRHVANGFGCGNRKSLSDHLEDGDDLHAELVKFKNKHYTADRMFLCVQSVESLESLKDLVVSNFSDLEKSSQENYDFEGMTHKNAFIDDFYDKIYLVKNDNKSYNLDLVWCLPPVFNVSFFSTFLILLVNYANKISS